MPPGSELPDLAVAEREYRRLLDRSLVPVIVLDGRTVRYLNPAAAGVLGDDPDRLVDHPIADVIAPPSVDDVQAHLAELCHDGDQTPHMTVGLLRADGAILTAHAVAAARIREGATTYEMTFCEAPATAAPAVVEHHVHAVLDLLHDGVVIMDHDGTFQFTNKAAREMLHSGAEDLVGMHHSSRGVDLPMYDADGRQLGIDSHPLHRILDTGRRLGGAVIGVDRLDGSRVWVIGHGCLMNPEDPRKSRVLLSFTDITEHYAAREQLQHDATHDWLTGLPNRGHALDKAAQLLAATGASRLSAVLFIDLDRLKSINDSHGHLIGDEVLRSVATRMRSAARDQDLVARIGGDEFVVLVVGPVDRTEIDAIAARLHAVLAQNVVLGSLTLRIGASIGTTTVSAGDSRSISDVLRDADTAMYRAKARGRVTGASPTAVPDGRGAPDR